MAQKEVKLNFLLMGKTGQGKSATGNSILNRKVFKASSHGSSVTKEVDFSFSQFGDKYVLMMVDGPGLEDTDENKAGDKEKAALHMSQALAMCNGGIDAFLFVFKFGTRFTKEDKDALDALKRIFGDTYLDHVIVVMTGGDLFETAMEEEECDFTFDEWCRRQRGELRQLYTECNGRFVLFNNREKNEEQKKAQIQKLVHLAENLQQSVGRYNSVCFERAKHEREKLILECKAPQLTQEIQEKISLLTAALELYSAKPTEDGKRKIINKIRELKTEIDVQDKGYGVLDHMKKLVDKVESNLDNTVELHRLSAELEGTRTAKAVWTALGSVCAVVGGAIAVVAAPVVGAGIAVGSAAATLIGRMKISSDEKQTEENQIKIKKKLIN